MLLIINKMSKLLLTFHMIIFYRSKRVQISTVHEVNKKLKILLQQLYDQSSSMSLSCEGRLIITSKRTQW